MALTKKIYPVLFLNSRYPLDQNYIGLREVACKSQGFLQFLMPISTLGSPPKGTYGLRGS
jgi:hypothetical protein